ncbi:MAG TPA: MFS transporter [Acidimicrobiales bacterium]|nr:MFS transporter [Acidimicrobiales bacterium]
MTAGPEGPGRPAREARPGVSHDLWALGVVCAVLFLTFIDTTIVSVALSDVQSRLHAGVTQLQWVVNGYALPFASLMLIAGSLSDRFGRKRVMLVGLSVFGTGSLLGALAPGPATLIGARVIMGVGAAASEPGTLSVIRHMYPDSGDRARALGAWAAVSGLALALGPVIGGALVGVGTFRAVFWFNVAAVAVVIVVAAFALPESADPQAARLDLPGFVAAAGGLGALTFAIILGETEGYRAGEVVVLFALGVVGLVVFIRVERVSRAPVLDLAYFREAPFAGAIAVVFVLFFGIFSIFFFTALYLSAVVGYSPYRVALEFVPMTVAMIMAAGLAGRRVALYGARLPMAEGCVLAGAGILLTEVLLGTSAPSLWLMATLALAGFGFGTSVVPVTSVALATVPPERSGMAASATNTSRELGAVFGVAVLGALVNAHLTTDLTHRLQALKIPANFISIVINGVEKGEAPTGVTGGGSTYDKVIEAAYGAFRDGLEVALITSGIALLAVAIVGAATLRGHDPSQEGRA